MKKSVLIGLFLGLFVTSGYAQMAGQPGEGGMMSGPMMGSGMMGGGMMRRGMMSMMQGMAESGPPGLRKQDLMGTLHRWGSYFFTRKDELEITNTQLGEIESILNSHIKTAIVKNAELKVLFIEVQELLVQDDPDLGEIERKLKAMETMETDMTIEGIRTLEQAMAALNPDQREKMRALFKESTYVRQQMMSRRGMAQGGMMGQGGMAPMMKGMMEQQGMEEGEGTSPKN